MDRFVRQLLSQPAIGADDELALARRVRDGDRVARDELIAAGMRSVALRARMVGLSGEELREAVQDGAIGLIRAVDRFDPERGARLATYAWHWIGAEMARTRRPEAALADPDTSCLDDVDEASDLLDGLAEPDVRVVRMRFGLADPSASPMTREAVGEQLGLTVSQVRTIEAKAMRQLRRRLAKVTRRAPLQGGADPP